MNNDTDIQHQGGTSTAGVPHYHLLTSRRSVPPFDLTQPADYIVAGDGVLMRIPYMGMLMDVPVVPCSLRGLAPWSAFCEGMVRAQGADDEDGEGGTIQPCAPCYHILDGGAIPPLDTNRFYEYLIAGNGVFLHAERRGIEIVMPVSPPCDLVGLAQVTPDIHFPYPLIGPEIVAQMLDRARAQTQDNVHYQERLFYLPWREDRWEVFEPEQEQTAGHVGPVDKNLAATMGIFCEAHSHHVMSAFFSGTDDRDELWSGFYAVLGHITTRPEIRLRVVVDGYRWHIPASLLYDLPEGVHDVLLEEGRGGREGGERRW